MRFERVLVVGAGQMGAGIAQVVAASGRQVLAPRPVPRARSSAGSPAMRTSLEKLESQGRPCRPATSWRASPRASSSQPADLMIEAIVEDAAAKEALFRAADAALPPEAILASNTSSIPITSLAAVTSRPDRVIGMHFFNPVPVLRLVEVIRALQTSDETAAAIVDARARPRQGAGGGERLPGLRLQPDPDAVHQRGCLRADGGRRRGGGDRHDREARVRAPDGPARARRPDRARHLRRDHGRPPRGPGQPEVRAVPVASAVRRSGPARPQERPRLLRRTP